MLTLLKGINNNENARDSYAAFSNTLELIYIISHKYKLKQAHQYLDKLALLSPDKLCYSILKE